MLLLVLLMLPLTAVYADSHSHEVFCGDLAAADCQLLHDSATAMEAIRSVSMEMTMQATTVTEDSDEPLMSLDGSGSGAIEISESGNNALMQATSNLSLEATVALLDELVSEVGGHMQLELTVIGEGESTEILLGMQMQNGVLFLSGESIAALMGGEMSGMGWIGLDMSGGVIAAMLQEDLAPNEDDPMETLSITRLPDSDLDGRAVAVYEMNSVFEDAAGNSSTITAWQYIDLDDLILRRIALSAEMPAPDDDGTLINTELALELDLSAFNEPINLALPEESTIVPMAMMMQMNNASS